ncbi:hypothetical protein [Pseudomonas sp. EA_35y_Pfl2_R111]|uniref:hypothetical protein n=1 Tax=Pseudomonas sp. EA_35y_Pfl2_R111 TaxID=3088689 RepID=UPI0030DA21D0
MRTYNELILYSLHKYLAAHQWTCFSREEGRYDAYRSPDNVTSELLIPDSILVNHKQSRDLLDEAIEVISSREGKSFAEIQKLLLSSDYDFFSLRESGAAISEGAISLASGVTVMSGVYTLFKIAASSAVNIKGKRNISRGYLESLRLSAPRAGSFIFNFDAKLYNPPGADVPVLNVAGVSSIGRLININFASRLKRFKSILTGDQAAVKSSLLREGIDHRYCNGVSSVFVDEADTVDFGFVWSFLEPTLVSAPEAISFDREDRVRIIEYSKILMHYQVARVEALPAYLESFTRREGEAEGRVYIRFEYDGRTFSTSVLVDGSLYESLNERHVKRQRVWVSGNLFFSDGSRAKVEAFEVKKIKIAEDVVVELF